MAFGNAWQEWNNLKLQDVEGNQPQARQQGPRQAGDPIGRKQPNHIGQQWPVRAQRAQRAQGGGMNAMPGIHPMAAQHFAAQNAALAQTNADIGAEMDSRRKMAGEQRKMDFQAQEAEKNRQHEITMAGMRQQAAPAPRPLGSGLTHEKLNVLEPLLTGTRKKRSGDSGPFSEQERVGNILKRLL